LPTAGQGRDVDPALGRQLLLTMLNSGLALLRYVGKIEPIASMSEDEVLAAMTPNLQRYIDGDLAERVNVDSASRL